MDLKRYLFEHGISQTDFARSIGYSYSYIRNLVHKRVIPSLRVVKTIEQATNGEVKQQDLEKKNVNETS